MVDNTIALQVKPLDIATPLMQAAKMRQMESEQQQQQEARNREAVASEMRGLAPYADSPEFAGRWAQSIDTLASAGKIRPDIAANIRNSPSQLQLRSILAQSEDPRLQFQREEAKRAQGNFESELALKKESLHDKGDFTKIGTDPRTGADQYGFVDKIGKRVIPFNSSAGGAGPSADTTGAEFLSSLDPGRAAQVKAIVEGRMAPPGGFALKSPQIQALMRDAAQYEPGFDLTKWTGRNNTVKDFSNGKAANNITAMNTVVGHLGDLMDKTDKLDNNRFPIVNTISNEVTQRTGGAAVNNFNLARNAVADELAKVFRSSGMSDHEIQQWKGTLNASMSPAQLKGAVQTAIGLMESRLSAMADQRNRGMDTNLQPRELLNEKSKAVLKKLDSWASGRPAAREADKMANDPPEISAAREAIAKGAPRDKVEQRLKQNGIKFSPADLDL